MWVKKCNTKVQKNSLWSVTYSATFLAEHRHIPKILTYSQITDYIPTMSHISCMWKSSPREGLPPIRLLLNRQKSEHSFLAHRPRRLQKGLAVPGTQWPPRPNRGFPQPLPCMPLVHHTPFSHTLWRQWDLFAFPLQTRKMVRVTYLPFSISSYHFHSTKWKLLNWRKGGIKCHRASRLTASLAGFWTGFQTRHAVSKLVSNQHRTKVGIVLYFELKRFKWHKYNLPSQILQNHSTSLQCRRIQVPSGGSNLKLLTHPLNPVPNVFEHKNLNTLFFFSVHLQQ